MSTSPVDRVSKKAVESGEKFDEIQREVGQEGSRFFDRLALISGGALVLSVSFLGQLSNRVGVAVVDIWSLYVSWGFLLGSLLAALFRNQFHQYYRYHTGLTWYASDMEKLRNAEVGFLEGAGQILSSDGAVMTPDEVNRHVDDLVEKRDIWSMALKTSKKRSGVYEFLFLRSGHGSQVAFVLGLLFLLFFAVSNTLF